MNIFKDIVEFAKSGKELTLGNVLKENKSLRNERDYYKNCIEHYKKEPSNIGKMMRLEEERYNWMETSGYMEHLYNESKNDNELLKDENARLNDMCFQLTQENASLDFKSKFLDDSATLLLEENKELKDRVEQLENELEIKERLDTDKPLEEDYYHTKELDYGLLSKTIDKITDERNTYKEIINVMCDKFDISHDSVLNILDDISQNKSVQKERV